MSSSSEPPSPTLGRTFLDRLTSVFHEEELNDRADVLEVLGEARRRNVIDDEVFSMMEGAMAVSEITPKSGKRPDDAEVSYFFCP